MGSVNISIRKEAYDFLRSLRKKNESFSEVILELKSKRNNKGSKEHIMKFFGALKDADINWKEREKNMKNFRDSFNKRMARTAKYMEEARKK